MGQGLSAEMSCGVRGSRCSVTAGAPGIDRTTLAEVQEYGVIRLLDELANELRQGRYRPLPARRVFIPKSGDTAEHAAVVDSFGS